MKTKSKLPHVGTNIFSIMSALAQEHNAINLSQGFPDFECDALLRDLVSENMNKGHNQYAPMPGLLLLREVLAEKIHLLYGAKVNPTTEITITAGGTQAIFTAIAAFVRSNDEVIIFEPGYDSYAPSVQVAGGKVVPYRLVAPNYTIDWELVKAMVTKKTRMIIINTPHNPTGTVLSRSDLLALQAIVSGSKILVLGDEVYEHLIFDGLEHQSLLRFPQLWERSIIVYSFGKTLHATGWKLGYVVAPEPLMQEFRKIHQFNVFSVNTPMQYAIASYLQDRNKYLDLGNFYQAKRDFMLHQLKDSPLVPLKTSGTYFQLYDYSKVSSMGDLDFCRHLVTQYGVAAIPVSAFYSAGSNDTVIRLCFAKKEETISAAAKLMNGL
jgi:methionine transaminase